MLTPKGGSMGTSARSNGGQEDEAASDPEPKVPQLQAQRETGATGLEPATFGVTGLKVPANRHFWA
jgi:hypothetical protein